MFSEYAIEVPGRFSGVFVDLETRKVPSIFVMSTGEMLKRRWQAFLAGVAIGDDDAIRLIETVEDGGEEGFLEGLGDALEGADVVNYAATREFDEMILKGRFTNARRAHASRPFYPVMPGVNRLTWNNLGKLPHLNRGEDLPSKGISDAYASGQRELVLVHLLRDVCEMIMLAGSPSKRCENWCTDVLLEKAVAWDAISGG